MLSSGTLGHGDNLRAGERLTTEDVRGSAPDSRGMNSSSSGEGVPESYNGGGSSASNDENTTTSAINDDGSDSASDEEELPGFTAVTWLAALLGGVATMIKRNKNKQDWLHISSFNIEPDTDDSLRQPNLVESYLTRSNLVV
jgi:hypothetical protein